MALLAPQIFLFQFTKTGSGGVTGKAASITAAISRLSRGSSPTITAVTTGGSVTVGSLFEVSATRNPGLYAVGVDGLDASFDYAANAHYTGTATDVDQIDMPSARLEFSMAISAGAVPQVTAGTTNGLARVADVPSASTNATAAAAAILQNPAFPVANDASGQITANQVTGNLLGSVDGDVGGKVLGGGSSQITAAGIYALDDFGNHLASAQSVSNIAVTGAALNATAASATYTTGTDIGGVTATATLNESYDQVTPVGGTLDFYYQFSLGSGGQVGVGVQWHGYYSGAVANGPVGVYAWNWGNAAWDQIGTVADLEPGQSGVNQSEDWELTSAHTGTGGNAGLVRVRFSGTSLGASPIFTDRILCGYAVPLTVSQIQSGLATSTSQTTIITNIAALPTAAQNAHAVWQDTTGSDFASNGSSPTPGSIIVQLGGIFTTVSSSVLTSGALANLPAVTLTAGTITSIQSGLMLASSYTAPDNADIVSALADLVALLARTDPTSALGAVKAVSDKVSSMLAASGANWTYTVDALKNAPAGGGGGGTTNLTAEITEVRAQ